MQLIESIPKLKPRKPDAHKGDFGRVCIIAGSLGMSGAAALAGRSALRAGAGLVRVATPKSVLPIVAAIEPSFTTIPLAEDSAGRISAKAINTILDAVNENGIVYVYNGTYYESILINKTLDLIGENKNTTIINGCDNENVITIKANSTTVKNFTIQHCSSNQTNQDGTGIYISPKCDGNEISWNIIVENSMYGIFIHDSYRNFIQNNIISSNGYGIGIINPTHGLFEEIITITCDNIILHNTIKLNEKYGIYIDYSIHNRILNNNFINNSRSKESSKNQDAYFRLSRYNEWKGTVYTILLPGSGKIRFFNSCSPVD